MSRTGPTIGFDRLIRLAWLDATAAGVGRQLEPTAIRATLDAVLDGQVAGTSVHSARGKTKTVLLRIWALPLEPLRPLRDDALRLFASADAPHRLALHWGMSLATYRFFYDVAATVSRLGDLQGTIGRAQVRRRIAERWGERTTIERALPRVIATMRDWDVLRPAGPPGVYEKCQPVPLTDLAIQQFLVEASFLARGCDSAPFEELRRSLSSFPFSLSLTAYDLRQHPRLEVIRLGMDHAVVVARNARLSASVFPSQLQHVGPGYGAATRGPPVFRGVPGVRP